MVNAAIEGRIPHEFTGEPFFGLMIPKSVPDVPTEVLDPRNSWPDKANYDAAARKLAGLFYENFKRFEAHAPEGVKAAAIKAIRAIDWIAAIVERCPAFTLALFTKRRIAFFELLQLVGWPSRDKAAAFLEIVDHSAYASIRRNAPLSILSIL